MQYFDDSLKGQPFTTTGATLAREIKVAEPRLRLISDADAAAPRVAGKWSRKQILGHLIDSAANNHQRFVRAQYADEIRLPEYAQTEWVESQHYDRLPWADTVDLWFAYNRQLAHVIQAIPDSRRDVACFIGDDPQVTLAHIALDYVAHLQHHMQQILP